MPSPTKFTGALRTWHDDKGFGFIAPSHGGAELFVHISAFPRDGSRPAQGELLSYEMGRGKDGKPQAIRVIRKALGADKARTTRQTTSRPARPWAFGLKLVSSLLLATAAGTYAFKTFQAHSHRLALEQQAARPAPRQPIARPAAASVDHRCDGRNKCSQMSSCQEATWFINHCEGMEMDGNHDGIPCEEQHCNATMRR
jgi:cold shock CspA family protein